MEKKLSEKGCVAGCKAFTGGEIRHHPDCVFYPDSLSKKYDAVESENERLRKEMEPRPGGPKGGSGGIYWILKLFLRLPSKLKKKIKR